METILNGLGARRSAWNPADVRGEAEKQIAATGLVAAGAVRRELAEDLTARAVGACVPLLDQPDVTRCWSSCGPRGPSTPTPPTTGSV